MQQQQPQLQLWPRAGPAERVIRPALAEQLRERSACGMLGLTQATGRGLRGRQLGKLGVLSVPAVEVCRLAAFAAMAWLRSYSQTAGREDSGTRASRAEDFWFVVLASVARQGLRPASLTEQMTSSSRRAQCKPMQCPTHAHVAKQGHCHCQSQQ